MVSIQKLMKQANPVIKHADEFEEQQKKQLLLYISDYQAFVATIQTKQWFGQILYRMDGFWKFWLRSGWTKWNLYIMRNLSLKNEKLQSNWQLPLKTSLPGRQRVQKNQGFFSKDF